MMRAVSRRRLMALGIVRGATGRKRKMTKPQTTKRKIVQIVACGIQENASTQCEMILHALCDDGTVWRTDNRNNEWWTVAPIPQGDVS